jgi:hypothetical protein
VSVALPFVNSPQNLQRHVRSYAAWLLLIAAAAAYYPRFVKLSAGMETYPQAASCLWHGQMCKFAIRVSPIRRQRRGGGSFYRLGLSAQRNGARHARSADLFRGVGDAAASEFK